MNNTDFNKQPQFTYYFLLQIGFVCIESNCKEQRSRFVQCHNEDHSSHQSSVLNLIDLKAKYTRQIRPSELYNELRNQLTNLLNIIPKNLPLYPNEINLDNLNRFGQQIATQGRSTHLNYQIIKIIEAINRIHIDNSNSENKALPEKIRIGQQLRLQGEELLRAEKYYEALESFNLSLLIYKEDDICWYNKGDALLKLQKYQEAIESYDLAIQIQPNNADYYYYKGVALY